jgi:glycosyltransferase involved in cell wall biosynthesis
VIRLYGITIGYASFARVAAGMRGALEKRGLIEGFVPLDAMDEYEDYPGPMAEWGIAGGPPSAFTASVIFSKGAHKRRMMLLPPNSSYVPQNIIHAAQDYLTGLIAPTQWAADTIKDAYDGPVSLWKHGIDQGFIKSEQDAAKARDSYKDGKFEVVHLSSTSFGRKGTVELIDAWAELCRQKKIGADPVLRLVMTQPMMQETWQRINEACQGDAGVVRRFVVSANKNMSVEDCGSFYRGHHIVCQPSRGEGFGFVPVEARACGVPICATSATGHSEHVAEGQPGVVVVKTGEQAEVDDGPNGMAPSLRWEDVAAALADAYERWPLLSSQAFLAADAWRERWSWDNVTGEWLRSEGIA